MSVLCRALAGAPQAAEAPKATEAPPPPAAAATPPPPPPPAGGPIPTSMPSVPPVPTQAMEAKPGQLGGNWDVCVCVSDCLCVPSVN